MLRYWCEAGGQLATAKRCRAERCRPAGIGTAHREQVAALADSRVFKQGTFMGLCRAGAESSTARRTGHARDTVQRSFENRDSASRYIYRTVFIQWVRNRKGECESAGVTIFQVIYANI